MSEAPLEIKPGKYRTRGGKVAFVWFNPQGRINEFAGTIEGLTCEWMNSGRASMFGETTADLIERIEDECDLHGRAAVALPSDEGRAVSVGRAEQRQHVSDAAFKVVDKVYPGAYFLETFARWYENNGLVLLTVAEHDELVMRAAVGDKPVFSRRQLEAERDALRAEVERLIGELRLQDQANDILTTEIERLRKGSDAKSALVPVAEIRPQDHPCGGPPIMRAYGHALSWTVDSLDHRLGRGNGVTR